MTSSTSRRPGEFELISRLCAGISLTRKTILGPGDDCAIISTARRKLLFTVDSMVEGVHFDLRWGRPGLLGARALAVNLSDVAAMGGRPTACVVNLAIRDGVSAATLDKIYAGLSASAHESRIDIVGGNITRASELSITIALLGEVVTAAMRRDTARPGDEIFVTGTVGDAALGWRLLSGELKASRDARAFLLDRFLKPPNRVVAGQRLAAIAPTPAAIDISDGLLQDLGHILERSRVGATLDVSSIPLSPAYVAVMGNDLSHALSGGEDYELLFCLRPGRRESDLARRLRVPVRRIGRITRGRRLELIGANQPDFSKRAGGWDQLRSVPPKRLN